MAANMEMPFHNLEVIVTTVAMPMVSSTSRMLRANEMERTPLDRVAMAPPLIYFSLALQKMPMEEGYPAKDSNEGSVPRGFAWRSIEDHHHILSHRGRYNVVKKE